jgi:integrase
MMAHLFKRGRIWQAKVKLADWPVEKKISLGTTDKRIAHVKLEALVSDFEKEAAGLLPSRPIREAREQPLQSLCEAFLADIKGGVSVATVKRYTSTLRIVRIEAGWTHLRHVTAAAFTDWLKHSRRRAKTCNDYLAIWARFFDWLRRRRMVNENPLEFHEGVDASKTAREYRRALTEAEGLRLLLTTPRGPRYLCYRLALESGIRPGELRRLRVADVMCGSEQGAGAKGAPDRAEPEARAGLGREESSSGPQARPSAATLGPCVRIPASISKNGKTSVQPISTELAALLRAWIPTDSPPFALVFPRCVPKCATFYRDLACAGIERVDALGRRMDMHALRKTFGTHLVLAGVEPRVVMELMRHSDLKLTMKTYMDAAQLAGPVIAAVARLPWNRSSAKAG